MLTLKSDDVRGRQKAFESIIKGLDIPQSSVPESFNVLVKELNALGLSIDYIS
jgi:DNA-directed RNA polymerase subunit beta